MSIGNLSVRSRLFLLLSLLAFTLIVVGGLGLRALQQANADLDNVYQHNFVAASAINEIAALSRDDVRALDLALMTGDHSLDRDLTRLHTENHAKIDKLWAEYKVIPAHAEEAALADDFMRKLEAYRVARVKLDEAFVNGDITIARQSRIKELTPLIEAMISAAHTLVNFQDTAAAKTNHVSTGAYHQAILVSLSSIVLALATAALFGTLLTRSISGSLGDAVAVAERIAQGQLGNPIQIETEDEFGRLLRAMQEMDSRLTGIVGSVLHGAEAVSSAARQISSGNDDLSQRTQEQASALEQSASSMEELTSTVRHNADNARKASDLAGGTHQLADEGGRIVGRAVDAMHEISESSERIAAITDVINEISFQTNLLALNAAVEAARAGEQGRGFAVVAAEVRNLAQRSASAAKEIKDLINDSVEKVKQGSQLVGDSGAALAEIVTRVKNVASIVAEISSASEEQANGIVQVNTAITQMDTTTQQNAALVEQAAAASKSMEQQAQLLAEHANFFKTTTVAQTSSPVIAQKAAPAPPLHRASVPKSPKLRTLAMGGSATPAPRLARASGDNGEWREF